MTVAGPGSPGGSGGRTARHVIGANPCASSTADASASRLGQVSVHAESGPAGVPRSRSRHAPS
ncbi:hypothetical protein, partial [Amycolatopsis vancoresmycina]